MKLDRCIFGGNSRPVGLWKPFGGQGAHSPLTNSVDSWKNNDSNFPQVQSVQKTQYIRTRLLSKTTCWDAIAFILLKKLAGEAYTRQVGRQQGNVVSGQTSIWRLLAKEEFIYKTLFVDQSRRLIVQVFTREFENSRIHSATIFLSTTILPTKYSFSSNEK